MKAKEKKDLAKPFPISSDWNPPGTEQEKIVTEINSKLKGQTQEILIEGIKDSKPFGRNRNDKIVFVATNESDDDVKLGDLVNVTIEETSPWYLKGTPVELK